MINIGVIGYGYWGPNLVRNFNLLSSCRVKSVSDSRPSRLELLKKTYRGTQVSTDYHELINDKEIDAVVVALPVNMHYQVAREALLKGKHVLVEKPMTASVSEAEELIDLAARTNKVLMVDHTFLYTGAVQKIRSVIDSGEVGEVKYFDSTRINLGLFQQDINVLWDLAPHDISILNFLVNERPVSVSATGLSHTANGIENIAYLTLHYQSNFIAHFSCSWSSPVKIRQILIGGSKKMILYDDVEPSEKIKIYDTGYSMSTDEEKHKLLVDYRTGDIYIPKVEPQEALTGVAIDFTQAIEKNTQPLSSALSGLEVVRILEAATASMRRKGMETLL
jgi:predicted dehydrogenase